MRKTDGTTGMPHHAAKFEDVARNLTDLAITQIELFKENPAPKLSQGFQSNLPLRDFHLRKLTSKKKVEFSSNKYFLKLFVTILVTNINFKNSLVKPKVKEKTE